MAAVLTAIGTVTSIAGLLRGGSAARRRAALEAAANQFIAEQLDDQAGQAIAASQRLAFEERRRARLVASRSLAVAAASGGGVSDPTVVRILSGIRGEGAYRASVALYEGESKARQLRIAAKAKRMGADFAIQAGRDRQRAFNLRAFGTALTSGVSLYAKYGAGGPSGDEALIEDNG